MDENEVLLKDIEELTSYGNFSIKRNDFDINKFGNFCIELVSNDQISIRFIRDKGTFWAEVGCNGEWYFIEDVFRIIGIDVIEEKSEVDEFLKYISKLLSANINLICKAFDANNLVETQVKIKKIAMERTLGMFKI